MSCACDSSAALATFDLPYYRGDTAPISAQLLNADSSVYAIEDGTLVTFQVFADSAMATIVWDKAIGQGIAIINAVQGHIAITPTLAETAALQVGVTYPAVMRVTDAGGALVTMGKGYLNAV